MIQDEIAQAVVDVLAVTLSPRERRAIKQVATADVRPYEHYLRGRKYYYQYGRRGIEIALQMFSQAIAPDPNYALAYAGIAHVWLGRNQQGFSPASGDDATPSPSSSPPSKGGEDTFSEIVGQLPQAFGDEG